MNKAQYKASDINLLKWGGVGLAAVLLLVLILWFAFSGEALPKVHDAGEAARVLADMAEDLGYENALSELTELQSQTVGEVNYFRLGQNYHGIPVYGRTVVCAADSSGELLSLTQNIRDITAGLDLTATVTEQQAAASVAAYLSETYSESGWNSEEAVMLEEDDLCIFDLEGHARLAYAVHLEALELVIDARDASVLCVRETVQSANATFAGTGASISVLHRDDGTYVLKDQNTSTYVFCANGKTFYNPMPADGEKKYNPENLTLVTSSDSTFGDGNDSVTAGEMVRAENMLNCVNDIRWFFQSIGGTVPVEDLVLVYDDHVAGFNGKNAGGGWIHAKNKLGQKIRDFDPTNDAKYCGLLTVGSEYCKENGYMTHVDIVAHEYTHIMTNLIVEWGNKDQTQALNEAFSDIFGELYEAAANGRAPDWIDGGRPIYDPSSKLYPEQAGEYGETGVDGRFLVQVAPKVPGTEDYSHFYSTVISHAAYKMNVGDDTVAGSAIPLEDLGRLWYSAMLMLPSDADFSDCRTAVTLAAEHMGLTEAQQARITQVFDDAGIQEVDQEAFAYQVDELCKVQVYGQDDQPFVGYTLNVRQQLSGLALKFDDPVRFTVHVREQAECQLKLEEGLYRITLWNPEDSLQCQEFHIQVEQGEASILPLYTDFHHLEQEQTTAPGEVTEASETEAAAPAVEPGGMPWVLERWDRSYTNDSQGWTNTCWYDMVVLQGNHRICERINYELRYAGSRYVDWYSDEALQAQPITDDGDPDGLNRTLTSRVEHNADGIFSLVLTDSRGNHTGMTFSLEVGAPLGLAMLAGKDSEEFREELCTAATQLDTGLGYDVSSYLRGLAIDEFSFYVRRGEIILLLPIAPGLEEMTQEFPTGVSISTAYVDCLKGAFQKPGTEQVENYVFNEVDRGTKELFGTKYHAIYFTLPEESPAYQAINEEMYRNVDIFLNHRAGQIGQKFYDAQFQMSSGFTMELFADISYREEGLVCFDFDYYHWMPGQKRIEGRYDEVYNLSTGQRISLTELAGMDEAVLLMLLKERILDEWIPKYTNANTRPVVNSLTLEDLNYGVWSNGEIVLHVPLEGIVEDSDENVFVYTGIYIH